MIYLIAGMIICLIVVVVMFVIDWGELAGLPISLFIVLMIASIFVGYFKNEAKVKSELINREFGTNYTVEEIFYAEDIIDEIRQIKRTRIDIQGLNNDDSSSK
jgi:hypothetical protein